MWASFFLLGCAFFLSRIPLGHISYLYVLLLMSPFPVSSIPRLLKTHFEVWLHASLRNSKQTHTLGCKLNEQPSYSVSTLDRPIHL